MDRCTSWANKVTYTLKEARLDLYPIRPCAIKSTVLIHISRADPTSLTRTSNLLIGSKATPFTIHTSLLISQSPYFRAALAGPFSEATSNTITLDDIDVAHF